MGESLEYYLHLAYVNDIRSINIKEVIEMTEREKAKENAKCILLVRVSTQHQDLLQQTEKVKAEAIKDGYDEKDIIILEDKESAVKLSEEERNGLNNLKMFIKQGNVSCVYTYEVSRISRKPAVLYSIRDFLIQHQVQLIILNPYMRMLKDDGSISETANIFFGIFSSMAENEGFLRKQRCQRGIDKKRELGLYFGGRRPFGYNIINKKLEINEEEANIIKRIFNDYVIKNKSLRAIASELVDEGLYDKRLSTHRTVLNIIDKNYYCGDKHHPQIISTELFEAAQAKRSNKVCYKKYNDALCKGILFDKNSGYRLIANNAGKQYYVKNDKVAKEVNNVSVSFKIVDPIVAWVATEWYNMISVSKQDEMIMTIKNEIIRQQNIISNMEKNITDNQDKIDRIEERYVDGKITKERADMMERKVFNDLLIFKQKISDAQNRITELNEQLENTKPNILNIRDKVLYIVDRVIIDRLARFVCEITIYNKLTNERRTYVIDTRHNKIINMEVKMQSTLNYYK